MKKNLALFLLILLALLSVGAFAQTVVSPIRFKLNGVTVTGNVSRNLSTYPYVTGFAALKQAVESRQLSVTITSGGRTGQVLLAVTTPPPTPPGGNTATLAGGFAEGSLNELMALAPFVPSNNQYSSWPTGNTTQYIERDGIKLGLLKSVGAALSHLSKNGGINQVNTFFNDLTPFEGVRAPDAGRSGGASIYGTKSKDYQEAGQTSAQIPGDDTGWNPVHGGSRRADRSLILFYERRTVPGFGEVLYAKTHPYQWTMNAVLGKAYIHFWWYIKDGAVRYYCIIEVFRDDDQKINEWREQELPFIYTDADEYHHYIPTEQGVREITQPSPVEGGGSDNQRDTGAFPTSENWIASLGDDGKGVIMGSDWNSRYRAKHFQSRSGDEFSNASSYINSAAMVNFDENSVTAYTGYIFLGSLSEHATWRSTQPINYRPFSFDFTGGKLQGWGGGDGFNTVRRVNGRYTFAIGSTRPARVFSDGGGDPAQSGLAKFISPFGRWQATDLGTIYIKGKWSTGINTIKLGWMKPGQTANDVSGQTKTVSFTATGNEQTLTVNMAGTSNWTGIISMLEIGSPTPAPNYNGSETFVPTYIGTTNPGN